MNLANPQSVFQLANLLPLVGWSWLIVWLFFPIALRLKTQYLGLVLPFALSMLYGSLMLVNAGSAEGGFDSLSNVMLLFNNAGIALAGWVHFLAFDLLIGWGIVQHSVTTRLQRPVVIVCLLMTFILGPAGLCLYGALQLARYLVPGEQWSSLPTDNLVKQFIGGHVPLARCAMLLLAILPILSVAFLMNEQVNSEVNIWLKPIKFGFALVVYTLTLSWFSNYVAPRWRSSKWFYGYSLVVVTAIILEMLWLVFAASIGEKSHFNQTHFILKYVYFLMGILAALLTGQSLVTGLGILKHEKSTLHSLTKYSLGFGLIATFFLTLTTAGYMAGVPAQSHAVLAKGITTYSENDTIYFTGWLANVGDLRVSHFFATHAMHIVPFIGWILACLSIPSWRGHKIGDKLVALTLSALYCIFVLATFIQALAGKPFI